MAQNPDPSTAGIERSESAGASWRLGRWAAMALCLIVVVGLGIAFWPRPARPTATVTVTETAIAQTSGCPPTWTTTAMGGWHGFGPSLGLHHQLVGHLALGVGTQDWIQSQHRYATGARFTSDQATIVLVPAGTHLSCF
jgi:hypothetical protein